MILCISYEASKLILWFTQARSRVKIRPVKLNYAPCGFGCCPFSVVFSLFVVASCCVGLVLGTCFVLQSSRCGKRLIALLLLRSECNVAVIVL